MIVGNRDVVDGVLTCMLAGGHALLEGVPGPGQDACWCAPWRGARAAVLAHPVHARPDARRRHRHHRAGRDRRGGTSRSSFQQGAHLRQHPAGRRDQPRHAQDAERAARGDAGARVTIAGSLRAGRAVLRARHAEPDGDARAPTRCPRRSSTASSSSSVAFPDRDELNEILERTTGVATPKVTRVLNRERLLQMQALVREVPVAAARAGLRGAPAAGDPPHREGEPRHRPALRQVRLVAARRAGAPARRQDPRALRRALRRLGRGRASRRPSRRCATGSCSTSRARPRG